MISGEDQRLVMYPCRNNTALNFVAMVPDYEVGVSSEGWNQSSSLEVLLKLHEGDSDDVKSLLRKAPPDSVKLWKLLDHEAFPTWVNGRVCLLGDAAHPFLPHQGQGGAQAIEDAAALGALFPLGTKISEIPNRLKLYFQCRYERCTTIQIYTRQSGFMVKGSKDGQTEKMDPQRFSGFNFDHDAYDHAFANASIIWTESEPKRPRQDLTGGVVIQNAGARYHTAYMTFKTKKSYLQTMMPTQNVNITSRGGWTTATFSATRLENLQWLGERGYMHFGLYIHNVSHTGTIDPSSSMVETLDKTGNLLPVLFENMADPIITGREELGFSKVFATLDELRSAESYVLDAGWEGTSFCKMALSDLVADEDAFPAEEPPIYQYRPTSSSSPGSKDKMDSQSTTISKLEIENGSKEKRWKAGGAKIVFSDLEGQELQKEFPTLAHIVDWLRRIEVSQVVEAGIRASQ